jgi:L-ascorbate metabolism protein UlaG (beta-lactamase superfamily)
VKIQLIRHASLWIHYAGMSFLVDPMFSNEASFLPIPNTAGDRRNPLVPLPASFENWRSPDAVLVTHLHKDHWDAVAAAALSKTTPILCQPGDEAAIANDGFAEVAPVGAQTVFRGVTIGRTGGQHGTGEIGAKMGRVSGFVLQADDEPTLYIAGDTIWCDEVRQALDSYQPDLVIVNAGGARFIVGDPITMDADDVVAVCKHVPNVRVAAVHMDAINHCHVTRTELRTRLAAEGLLAQVSIPEDGEWL